MNTSVSLALANETLAFDGPYVDQDEKGVLFQRGKELAERAHPQFPYILGRLVDHFHLFGKPCEVVKANFEAGDLYRINEAWLRAQNLDPKNGRACTGLATFHAPIVSQNWTFFNAHKQEILANYQCDLENDSENNMAHLAYAKGLWLLDANQNTLHVRKYFQHAVALSHKDAFGEIADEDAKKCLDELNSKDTLDQCRK